MTKMAMLLTHSLISYRLETRPVLLYCIYVNLRIMTAQISKCVFFVLCRPKMIATANATAVLLH